MNNITPPDGGCRAYSVVFGSFLCNGLIFGLVNSYSVVCQQFLTVFEHNGVDNFTPKASLIGSLTIGTTFFLSMIAGMVSDRIGIRMTTFIGGFLVSLSLILSSFFVNQPYILFITYGVLFGIGASFAYIPSLTIIGHYFEKYIGIANGVVTVGSSTFSIAMPYVLRHLLNTVGLSLCLRYIGYFLSTLMLCSLIFKPIYKPQKVTISEEEDLKEFFFKFINLNIWKNSKYIIWVIAVPLALCGYFVPYVHMASFVNKTYPGRDSNLPLVCIAVTSGIGRLIFGPLSDLKKVDSILLQQISFTIIGIVSILVPLTSSYEMLLGLNLILGIFDGCFISVIGPIAFHICGSDGAGQAIGFILGLSSFPLIIGPPVAGWLYDQYQSYTVPYILSGIPPILGALLLTRIHFIKRNVEERNADIIDCSHLTEHTKLAGEAV